MKRRHVARVASAFVFGLMMTFGAAARALPRAGDPKPTARVVDADRRVFDLASVVGRPVLVLYEDKESVQVNAALKADLAALAKGDRYRAAIALVPVADVERFDFWPVRGFVERAIRAESEKVGAVIYCDWDGSFRRAVGLPRATSSVVLFGREGRVRSAAEGMLSAPQREHLVSILREEVGGAR